MRKSGVSEEEKMDVSDRDIIKRRKELTRRYQRQPCSGLSRRVRADGTQAGYGCMHRKDDTQRTGEGRYAVPTQVRKEGESLFTM